MTLSFRNKAIKVTIGLAAFMFITLIACIGFGVYSNHFSHSIEELRLLPIFSAHYFSIIASVIFLCGYVIIAGLIIFFLFQKTQSAEVIYFNIFLVACLFENLRFLILFVESTGLYSNLILLAARGVFLGQTCAPLSFVIAAVFLGRKQEENIERYCSFIFAASIICAFFVPFNTNSLTSNAMLTYGFMAQINIARIIFAIIAFFCFLINSTINETFELKPAAYGFLLLYLGYLALTITDNFPLFFFGSALLSGGTFLFLHSLHRYFLWK